MKGAAAINARFVDYGRVATRKQFKLVFEVPLEEADKALAALGGTPVTGDEKWCALALLNPALFEKTRPPSSTGPEHGASIPAVGGSNPPADATIRAAKLSTDAFWMCRRRDFQEWLGVNSEAAADHQIKSLLRISSKTELDADDGAAIHWRDLIDRFHAATMPQERPS